MTTLTTMTTSDTIDEDQPLHIFVDSATFLAEEQQCVRCEAVVWLPGTEHEIVIANYGGGEYVTCPGCHARYYASGDEGRFARQEIAY